MGMLVCSGAAMTCSFGTAPATLAVTPERRALAGLPAACVADMVPGKNIPPFAMCSSPANPAVAAATAAALGVLTPQPCVPAPMGPWAPGNPTVLIGGVPALNSISKLSCIWSGVIQIATPGQNRVMIK